MQTLPEDLAVRKSYLLTTITIHHNYQVTKPDQAVIKHHQLLH